MSNPQGASMSRRKSTNLKAKPVVSRKMKRILLRSDHHVEEEQLQKMNLKVSPK